MAFRQFAKRVLTPPLFVVAAAYVLFEDTILHWATLGMREISRLPAIAWLERQIARLPPYPALLLFLLPIALLFPVKLLALWAIARGHVIFGAIIVLAAKTISTTLEAALYRILRPSLGRLDWFVAAETWLFAWRDRLYAYVRGLPAWQRLTAGVARAKAWLRRSFASLRRSASPRKDVP
jgi:hypothetical protein